MRRGAANERGRELIVGHGVLGQLLARLTRIIQHYPTVWERDRSTPRWVDYAVYDESQTRDTTIQWSVMSAATRRCVESDDCSLQTRRNSSDGGFYSSAVTPTFHPHL